MRLNIRIGDSIILAGAAVKITKISELNVDEKLKVDVPLPIIARRVTFSNETELIFLN